MAVESALSAANKSPGGEERALEPLWSLFALSAALFLTLLYGCVFLHPTRGAVLSVLTVGPLALRLVFALAGRFAPLGKAIPPHLSSRPPGKN